MSRFRTVTTSLLVLLLCAIVFADGAALTNRPIAPVPPSAEADMPPLEGGSPYNLPVWASDGEPAGTAASGDSSLTIDVWYGNEQTFGQLGNPQPWLNILGSVSGPRALESLSYSLNGGPERPLSIGSDARRIYDEGDFNIELDYAAVTPLPGTNTVIITADDGQDVISETISVLYQAGTIWPLPYMADWSAVATVPEGGQVVDGLWRLADGQLENVVPGFDRLVAIGDMSWTEYEVTVPVIVHTLNSDEWRGPSNGGGVGIIVRWPGHYNIEGEQPSLGWRHLGALGWYHWSPDGSAGFELRGERGQLLATRSDQKIQLEVPYIFKMRVESVNGPGAVATYSFKFWKEGEPEPNSWTLQALGRAGEPTSGSAVLVAHQSEVSFGDVSVVPLDFEGFSISRDPVEHGRIEVSPQRSSYQLGEQVEFTAVPELGYRFAGWLGDLTGDENPQTITMFSDLTVGALFEQDTFQIFISPVASGNVGGLSYLKGDILALSAAGQWTRLLRADAGPFGLKSDIEAFSFMDDGSLLVVLSRKQTLPGVGLVTPSDVLRIRPSATGDFNAGSVDLFLIGSEAGLTTLGERINALTLGNDGRLWISTMGVARVMASDGTTLVAHDEDVIAFTRDSVKGGSSGTWEVICDGSLVPGLAKEIIAGLAVDAPTGNLIMSFKNTFNVAGVTGTARDVVSLSDCSPTADVSPLWSAQNAGYKRPFDGLEVVR